MDGKRVEEVEGGKERWKGWKGGRGGEREVEGWKRGVCVWNQVAGSCILSGVAGHTFHTGTSLQCNALASSDLSYKR